jgi:hypothetical protein
MDDCETSKSSAEVHELQDATVCIYYYHIYAHINWKHVMYKIPLKGGHNVNGDLDYTMSNFR